MIPSADCPCDTGPEVCCDTLFLKGDRIRTIAWNAVLDCSEGGGCCEGVEGNTFMALGPQIVDPFGDSVIVALADFSPVVTTRGGHTPEVVAHRAEYRVEVRSSGWPIIEMDVNGTYVSYPSADTFHSATKHVSGHAEKAYRALTNAIQTHTLFPGATHPEVIFKGTQISGMRPIQSAHRIAGYGWSVAVDVAL